MQFAKGPRWFVLAAVLGFAASGAQAEMITPDSIPNPPGAIGSAGGTPVSSANLVSTQYSGQGLNFSFAAITRLSGVTVWAPAQPQAIPASYVIGWPPSNYPPARIGYMTWMAGGSFVDPGTGKPTSVYSMTLEIMGAPVTVDALNSKWQVVASTGPDGIGPQGGYLYTLSGGGIRAFTVSVPELPVPDTNYPAWGVASVSFVNNPEPSSLLLASLGALSLAARFGWRRTRHKIA